MANVKLLVDIEANSAKLVSEMGKANKALDGMKKSANDMQKSLSLISAASIVQLGQQAINAAQQFYNFARSIASSGNDIQRMARVFNMTTDDFQKWSYVTKMADVDIEGFGQGFKFLTRSMSEALQGSGDAAKAFNLLGINLKDSTGKTKDQQTVMMEVIDTLGKYADGVDRDALMLAIFGRGWMSVKPLVDQGTKAIEENRREVERLNAILGKDTIKILSESEDAFKRWEAVWKASKISFWTPMLQTFTDLLEKILALKTALREGGFKGLWEQAGRHELEVMEEQNWKFYGGATKSTKDWVAGWTPGATKAKPQAPGIVDEEKRINKLLELNKDLRDSLGKQAIIDERMAWAELGNEMTGTMPTFEQTIALNKALKEVLESSIPIYETVKEDWGAIGNELVETAAAYGITIDELIRIREALNEGVKDNAHFIESFSSSYDVIETLSSGISSAWSTNMTAMIKGTQSFGETIKNIFTSMADSVVSSITKMIANLLLFGTISGGQKKEGGYGGLIGLVGSIFLSEGGILPSHFTPIRQFAGGGVASRPTLGMVGEGGGPEAVVPLRGGGIPVEFTGQGSGGNYTLINIQATDVKSFEEQLKRNPNAIVEIIYKNARGGGAMKDIVRSMT